MRRLVAGCRLLASRFPLCALPAFALVALSLLAGCAARRPLGPHPAPAVLPSAADLEAALAARRAAVRSLRALAHLRVRAPDESSTSREAIVVARPDRIRVEVLSVFGAVFVLTANDGALTAYARQEGTFYRGQASPENLWRYARLWLPVNDLVDIVLGTPPEHPGLREEVSFDAESGWIRLSRPLDRGTQVVWFSGTVPVAMAEWDTAGQQQWRATFAEHETRAGWPIATRIDIELPAWSRSVEVALDDIDLNPALDHSIFALQTPPGSRVVDLDRLAD